MRRVTGRSSLDLYTAKVRIKRDTYYMFLPINRMVSKTVWQTVFTFEVSKMNYIHNIVPDRANGCLWILAGDLGEAAAIWTAKDNFRSVVRMKSGSQEVRACVAFPEDGKFVNTTDSPF